MTALVEQMASQGGPATRQQLREAVRKPKAGRPAETLRICLPADDQGVQSEIELRQEPRQRDEIIDALEAIIRDLRRNK